ncbi:MAG: hypothetical protein V1809_02190 [Planctomycetota bacterium]
MIVSINKVSRWIGRNRYVVSCVCLCGLLGMLIAATVTIPNTFTDGTVASAPAVNSNFTAVANAVNGLATNTGSNAVHWGNLTGVPAGFADGTDNTGIASESDTLQTVVSRGATSTSSITMQNPNGSSKTQFFFKNSSGVDSGQIGPMEAYQAVYIVGEDYLEIYHNNISAGNLIADFSSGGFNLYLGTKNFVEPHPTDPTKEIVYVTLEGPEAGTYCRGKGVLTDGTASISLPDHFGLVTADEGITVQVTPTASCNGLYVDSYSKTGFVVKELGGGNCNATFHWTVNGVREKYKNHQVIRDAQKSTKLEKQ